MTMNSPRRRDFSSNVGVDLIGIAGNGWFINGIIVDNPTGAWLKISGINDFVPPYTQGWSRPVTPAAIAIDITFESIGPGGSSSDLVGEPISVTIIDQTIEVSNGQPIAPPGISINVTSAFVNFTNVSSQVAFLAAPDPDRRYRIWGWESMAWAPIGAGGWCRIALVHGVGLTISAMRYLMDSGGDQRIFFGGFPWPSGTSIDLHGTTSLAGNSSIMVAVHYTEEAA